MYIGLVMNPGLRDERPATNSLKHGTAVKRLMVSAVIFLVNIKFVNLSLCHGTAVNNEVEYSNILLGTFLLKKQFHYCNFKHLNGGITWKT
jgi:hypothetical protein